MGLKVMDETFVGNYAGLLESVHTLPDLNVDVATRVSDGEEGVFNDHLVQDIFEMDPYVLGFGNWVVEVVVDDVCLQVAGPFAGFRDDGVEMDLETQEDDC